MKEIAIPVMADPSAQSYFCNLDTNFQFIFKLRADYLSDLQRNFLTEIITSQIKFWSSVRQMMLITS